MDSLNQIELQNIRHIVGMCNTVCTKVEYYKTLTTDQNLTQIFDDICSDATGLKSKLSGML